MEVRYGLERNPRLRIAPLVEEFGDGLPGLVEEFGDGLAGPLEAALHELSPAEREVVALRVLLELDGPSAARVLGISQTACSTRLSRALRRLEERMNDVGE